MCTVFRSGFCKSNISYSFMPHLRNTLFSSDPSLLSSNSFNMRGEAFGSFNGGVAYRSFNELKASFNH